MIAQTARRMAVKNNFSFRWSFSMKTWPLAILGKDGVKPLATLEICIYYLGSRA